MSGGELDLTGWRCPMPVILLEKKLRAIAPGAALKLRIDDPLARLDVPRACAEGGHGVEELPPEGEICVFRVTRGPNST